MAETQPPPDRRLMVRSWITTAQAEIARALPSMIDPERFVRVALTAINQNPRLLQATKESLIIALLRAAALGLEPDGILGQAYLIPRNNRKKGVIEANFQPGYQGLLDLARRSGDVSYIAARVVRERDKWTPPSYGLKEDAFTHEPYFGEEEPGKIIAAYCVTRLVSGEADVVALPYKRILTEHRAFSTGYDPDDNDCPWVKFEEAMIVKTMLTLGCKYAPKSAELRKAAAMTEKIDRGVLVGDESTLLAKIDTGKAVISVGDVLIPETVAGKDDAPPNPDYAKAVVVEAKSETKKVEKKKPEQEAEAVPVEDRDVSNLFE